MNTLEKLKILLKFGALIGLVLSLSILYLRDIFEKYEKKATTITTSREQLEFPTWPATTFCMQKPFKPSVMIEETGTPNRDIFRHKPPQVDKVLNQSLLDTFYKAAYKLNRDFELHLLNTTDDSILKVIPAKVGENSISSKVKIIVEEFPTEMDGLCYSLTYRVKENTYPALFFGIIPKKELLEHPIDNPNGVTFFLTTENTRKNIIQRNWPYLTPQIIGKKFTLRNSAHIFFEETEFRFFNGNPNCQLGCLPTECLDAQDILANTTCPEKCLPIHLASLYEETSICNTIEANTCMYSHYIKVKNQKLVVNCGPPESDIQYATFVKDDEFLAMQNPQPAIFPRIGPFSQTKLVKEEIRIYDDASIVAALGGFFGLFIGFSFYGSACFLIDKVIFCPNK